MRRVAKPPRITWRSARGVTLVELIMFMVIVGVVAAAMVQAFSGTMRGSHLGKDLTQATQLAQQRMEVILGQRKRLGYAGFTVANYDPCLLAIVPFPASQACATTASFAVTSAPTAPGFAADACGVGTGTNCRLVTVTVTGPQGDTLTILTAQVWNY